ncbi:hypothetical protein PM082_020627 [Marasmius tenuissimus]|nr:hypothetical protein PM082_020627 [Marasmius tenuissimus]
MERHMQVAQEVNEELESLVRGIDVSLLVHVTFQQPCGIPYSSKNIDVPPPSPTPVPGKSTGSGRIVVQSTNIVHLGRPPHLEAKLISPRSDGGKVTFRFVRVRRGEVENFTDCWEHSGMEVNLGNRRNDFETHQLLPIQTHRAAERSLEQQERRVSSSGAKL